jgi:hypothetical protein
MTSFKIEGAGFKQVDLKIFNRWGEKVFETDKQTSDGMAMQEAKKFSRAFMFITLLSYSMC